MARTLDVYLQQDLVGHLEQDDSGALSFKYGDAWLVLPSAVPLSASLPLRGEAFGRNECRPFFAGLLPEETSRKMVARFFGVSDKNDFAILEKIGGECAGAVSLMPVGETPMSGSSDYREISSEELAEKFADIPRRPLLIGEEGIRLSLAGAQEKMAVAIDNGKFHVTLGSSPSTHILKPESANFGGLVANEFFCMRLAAKVGLEVAGVEIGTAGITGFLQVERFDRTRMPDGKSERIHQEDFCQAMGIAPELKYQQEGGPNLKRCFELVRAVSSAPGPDVLRLFDAVVFNYVIGNNDAHGKNFSILYEKEKTRFAPLYDLVCTQAYPMLANEMAMKIGGERDPERVFARNWRKFFNDAGVSQAAAVKRLVGLAERVRKVTTGADSDAVAATVLPVVIQNCERLIHEKWG